MIISQILLLNLSREVVFVLFFFSLIFLLRSLRFIHGLCWKKISIEKSVVQVVLGSGIFVKNLKKTFTTLQERMLFVKLKKCKKTPR